MLECYELAFWQERLERRPEQLVIHPLAPGARCGDVQVNLNVWLGEDKVIQPQQTAVDRGSGLDLKRLSDDVLSKP